MKLTYDPRHNVAYIRLRESGTDIQTLRISEELLIDIAPDGSVYGFEFLNANEQLRSTDGGNLVVVDSVHGTKQSLVLPPAAE